MQRIEICTEAPALSESLARYVRSVLDSDFAPIACVYGEGGVSSAAVFRRTSLFIFGLFRTYPEGRRAEGLPAAAACVKAGKPALIISAVRPPCGDLSILWCPSCEDPLDERIRVLMRGFRKNVPAELDELKRHYAAWLRRPSSGH